MLPSAYRTLCRVLREFGYLENTGTFAWSFVSNSGLRIISPRHTDRRKCCQLSLTDDCFQFNTLSVHLCVQHYGRDNSFFQDAGRPPSLVFNIREI